MDMLRLNCKDMMGLGRLVTERLFIWAATTVMMVGACTKPTPPQPTVASVEASRDGATIKRAKVTLPIGRNQRLEAGSEVTTPAGVRASLYLDAGAWVLLDQGSTLALLDKGHSGADFELAQEVARLTGADKLLSVAGGGDTVAALAADGPCQIHDAGAASVSFPEFYNMIRSLSA